MSATLWRRALWAPAWEPSEGSEAGLLASLLEAAGWSAAADVSVFAYSEGVSACTLERIVPGRLLQHLPSDAWSGRLFDADVDARWAKTAEGLRAWLTREGESAPGDGWQRSSVEVVERRYYLNGISDRARTDALSSPGVAVFTEGRFPGKEFCYPSTGGSPKDGDRAYVIVHEYQAAAPAWPTNEADIEAALDQPLLVGHRFVGVGIGRD